MSILSHEMAADGTYLAWMVVGYCGRSIWCTRYLFSKNVGVKVLQIEVLYSSFFFLKTQINYTSHPSKLPDTSTDTNSGSWLINTEEPESRTYAS